MSLQLSLLPHSKALRQGLFEDLPCVVNVLWFLQRQVKVTCQCEWVSVSVCVSPLTECQPVQGLPLYSSFVSWDWLQPSHDPLMDMWI